MPASIDMGSADTGVQRGGRSMWAMSWVLGGPGTAMAGKGERVCFRVRDSTRTVCSARHWFSWSLLKIKTASGTKRSVMLFFTRLCLTNYFTPNSFIILCWGNSDVCWKLSNFMMIEDVICLCRPKLLRHQDILMAFFLAKSQSHWKMNDRQMHQKLCGTKKNTMLHYWLHPWVKHKRFQRRNNYQEALGQK